MDFSIFGKAVSTQFKEMVKHGLYRADVARDLLWDTYLGSFPEGTNPIYKERTEHDCQCCRQFIKNAGAIVSIIDGKLVSIWDILLDGPYQVVADGMAKLVKAAAIDNIFLHTERTAGTSMSLQRLESGEVLTWKHFFVELPAVCVLRGDQIGPKLSDSGSTRDVFLRSLKEITKESIDTALDLISQNSLYRGEEHRFVLESLLKMKKEFIKLKSTNDQDLFCWQQMKTVPASISRIRNTAIGSLLVDLSDGKELEAAVASFEAKVAPQNYKRPTALITKAMIQKAQEKIKELGFESALERRYATLEDITINNILHANRETKKAMNVFEDLASKVPEKIKNLDKVEEVTIENFINNILPKAESLEVMFENRHSGNLVSLIAPVDPDSKNMFKWPNNFSWSYTGEVTDSIKERVKQAGGTVTGDLCCRLAWDYTDDLDFHMKEPGGRGHIYYGNRRQLSINGGMLDVDANGADGLMKDPVENIFYANKNTMREGVYELSVHNFSRRSNGVGFETEIEIGGALHHFVYEKALRAGETVIVARIQYSKAKGFEVLSDLKSTQSSKQIWGIPTQSFQKVNVVMHSPNHWDEKTVGNKHYFFMLDGCLNEGQARGFFNEFLTEELNTHRKVFEVVGAKMKTEESANQLSGLGFSSTQRNHVLCRIKGSFARTVKITF